MENEIDTNTINFIVICRKWFDKVNGNTYHSIRILDNKNKIIAEQGLTYGYDEQYKQTAKAILNKLGLLAEKDNYNHELLRRLITWIDEGYGLKRDLFNGDGKT